MDSKPGEIFGYASLLGLLPTYSLGFTTIASGDSTDSVVEILADLISVTLPSIEDTTREEAGFLYSGTYSSSSLNSSVNIITSFSSPGLIVSSWISNNTDVLPLPSASSWASPSVRLYPTGLESIDAAGHKKIGFQAVFEDPNTEETTRGLFSQTWRTADAVVWGSVASDEFSFVFGEEVGEIAKGIIPRIINLIIES